MREITALACFNQLAGYALRPADFDAQFVVCPCCGSKLDVPNLMARYDVDRRAAETKLMRLCDRILTYQRTGVM